MNLSKYAITLSRPVSLVFWFSWHFLAAAAIVVITACFSMSRYGAAAIDTLGVGMAATYVTTAILLTFYITSEPQIRVARLVPTVLSPFSIFFLFLLLTNSQHSRSMLLISFAAALALSIFPFSLRWTEKNLDAFLRDPQSFAPGTSMQLDGIGDPAERASLIEYLKSRKELSHARTP